ncbi:MAG: nucleotidyltransferase [Elusimicrobia bacterium]|nr:nucleotidyltransferase [Elusimicrobiota bacterium]
MRVEKDFEELLRLFNKNKVRYCIVGAYAVAVYITPRYTKDIDIFIETSVKNAERIKKAVDEFGMGGLDLSAEDFLKKGNIVQLGYEPVRIDIITDIPDCNFKQAWKNKKSVNYGKEKVYVIGIGDLIKSKLSAGRKIDEADLEKLLPLRKRRRE